MHQQKPNLAPAEGAPQSESVGIDHASALERAKADFAIGKVACRTTGSLVLAPTYRAIDAIREIAGGRLDKPLDFATMKALNMDPRFWDWRLRAIPLGVGERDMPIIAEGSKPRELIQGVELTAKKMESLHPEQYFSLFLNGTLRAADLVNVRFSLVKDVQEVLSIGPLANLGSGGQGTVTLVETDRLVNEQVYTNVVAMKSFHREEDADRETANMLRGAACCRLIPPVLHAFQAADGTKFIMLPYQEGETLGSYLRRIPELGAEALSEIVSIARQVIHSGKTLVTLGLLPDDANFSNIMVHPMPGAPSVRFIDFGMAGNSEMNLRILIRELFSEAQDAASHTIESFISDTNSRLREFCSRALRAAKDPWLSVNGLLQKIEAVETHLATGCESPSVAFDLAGLPPLD